MELVLNHTFSIPVYPIPLDLYPYPFDNVVHIHARRKISLGSQGIESRVFGNFVTKYPFYDHQKLNA